MAGSFHSCTSFHVAADRQRLAEERVNVEGYRRADISISPGDAPTLFETQAAVRGCSSAPGGHMSSDSDSRAVTRPITRQEQDINNFSAQLHLCFPPHILIVVNPNPICSFLYGWAASSSGLLCKCPTVFFMWPGHEDQSADYKLCRSMCSSVREAQCFSLDRALAKLAMLQSPLRMRHCSKGAAALL